MSYIGSPFDHDLFISYSHGVSSRTGPLLQPWSAEFVQALDNEMRMSPRLTEDLAVFLDASYRPGDGIDPMAGLTPQLQEQIERSGILVVLMSPHYLKSDWCARERNWWSEAQTRLGWPTDKRIAVVHILPTTEKWPASLCDPQGEPLLGFRLHDEPGPGIDPRPVGWFEVQGGDKPKFGETLRRIVGSLSIKLDELKSRAESLRQARSDADKLQGAGGQALYLHGRKTQQAKWEQVALELAAGGYSVLPGEPDPEVDDPQARMELRARRVEVLADCDALLLLGAGDGRLLDSDLLTVGRHDRQSARARSNRPLPCGVFDTVGASIATPVRRATARNIQADWLDATQNPLVPRISQWLTEKGAEAEQRL